jgi:hypothetical protein
VKCSDGSYKFAAQLCPGQTPSTATGTNATSGVAYCADGITINTGAVGSCPSKTSATSCPAGTFFDQGINGCKSSSVSTASVNQSCPAGSYYNQGAGGCTSSTAQVATIKCADGSYRVTALECQNSGGAVGSIVSSATGATCSSGYAPNSSGYCVPISNNASATQTIKCWDGSQVPITSACPTAPANGASGGINCPSGSFFDSGINGCKTLVATAAGSALGGACLEGYAPNSSGFCIPTASLTAAGGKSTGPISTQIDPCKVVPVPPSCIASGAVTVTERTVVQAQAARFTPPPSASADAPPPSGAKEATGLVAPPAKNGKKAPPVLVFNVLGADNKELTDSDGKTLTTKPAVKAGNTVFVDKNGSPVITAPTLDPAGKPVTGPDGNVLYTKLMTFAGQEPVTDSTGKAVTAAPLLAANGKPLQAANGKVVYAPPVLDVKGNVILNSYGAPVLAQPLSDSSGSIAVGPDGEPICIQPIVVEGGKAIVKNGAKVYVGAVGVPALTSKNQTITTAFGQDVTFGPSGTLADEGGNAVLGPDGRPVMLTATGTPIASNGAPLLDKNGKPIRVTATGGVTDSSGRPILGADGKQIVLGKAEAATQLKSGKNVIKSADGKQVTVGLNGALVDLNGNPVLTSAGKPIFIDPATKSFKDPTGKAVTVSKTGVLTSAKSNPLQVETGAIDAA